MKEKVFPEEISEIFEKLRTEIVWLHGRWIIFEQLYATSPERVDLLNETASSFFHILQTVLIDDVLMYIGRLTDKPETGRGGVNKNLSLGQVILALDREQYPELLTRLDAKLEQINTLSEEIRLQRDKKLAHYDMPIALKKTTTPTITFNAIKDTLKTIREFMDECELYFLDSETAYEALVMPADGQALINKMKKAIAYEELEKQGLIEHRY